MNSQDTGIPRSANLSNIQKKDAIRKIDRRLNDLEAFDPNEFTERNDPRIASLEQKIESLITDIFGFNTIEYNRYHYSASNIDTASFNMYRETSIREVREGLEHGKQTSIITLKTIKDTFIEDLDDAGLAVSKEALALRAYEGLELHPEIERACGKLYQNGHYANAIEDAVKALNGLVRLRSGCENLDGTKLMEKVLGGKEPTLAFNKLKDESDRNEQRGFMMMFSGAVAGLRNPRAHKLTKDDPERAIEFLAYISLLAKLLDDAEKMP